MSSAPYRGRRSPRAQGAGAATKIAYRVTYSNGVEKTFQVQTENINTGFHKVLYAAHRWHPRTPDWQIVRIEHIDEADITDDE